MGFSKARSTAGKRKVQHRHQPLLTRDLSGLEIPGVIVEIEPEMAGRMGAFEEEALSEEEAWESNDELLELHEGHRHGRA